MSTDVFRRVVWKEFRLLRSFWIVLLGTVLLGQAAAWTYADAVQMHQAFYGIAWTGVALYVLGAAASVFAVEHEEGTDALLLAMPVQSRQLFVAKVAWVVFSTVALTAALFLLTNVWRWTGLQPPPNPFEKQDPPWAVMLSGVFFVGILFVWGTMFSMLLDRPLVAACATPGLALILFYVARWMGDGMDQHFEPGLTTGIVTELIIAATVVAGLAYDFWLGGRWLERERRPSLAWLKRRRTAQVAASPRPAVVPRQSTLTEFGRLTWQELRQSWRLMLVLLGVGALFAVWIASLHDPAENRLSMASFLTLALVAILGSCVFLADQERSQFRFFAERPVRPRLVWLNRQLIWGTLVAFVLTVAVPLWVLCVFRGLPPLGETFARSIDGHSVPWTFTRSLLDMPAYCLFLVFAVLAYACGQLSSIVFRSGIVAGFFGVLLAAIMCAWTMLLTYMRVNWLIGTAPIIGAFLWASWYRAPHWISERSDWRAWTRLGLSVAVPLIGVAIGTVIFRVVQIPAVNPGFSPADYNAAVTPAARETADMYLRAQRVINMAGWSNSGGATTLRGDVVSAMQSNLLPSSAEVPVDPSNRREYMTAIRLRRANHQDRDLFPWLLNNQEALTLTIAASQRPECIFPQTIGHTVTTHLETLLGTDAQRLALAGDLDAAFDRELSILNLSVALRRNHTAGNGYNYGQDIELRTLELLAYWWGTRPGQTPERIRRALAALEHWESTIPPPSDANESGYMWIERLLNFDPNAMSQQIDNNRQTQWNVARYVFFSRVMPWEVIRARRALNLLSNQLLAEDRAAVEAVAERKSTAGMGVSWRTLRQPYVESTPWLATFAYQTIGVSSIGTWRNSIAMQRATRILLALEGWRLEHGELPDKLDALVGTYFQELPSDPFTGDNFQYFRNGWPTKFKTFRPYGFTIVPEAPFLWSPGENYRPVSTQNWGKVEQEFEQMDWYSSKPALVRPLQDVIHAGWTLPIGPLRIADFPHDSPEELEGAELENGGASGGPASLTPEPSAPVDATKVPSAANPDEPSREPAPEAEAESTPPQSP